MNPNEMPHYVYRLYDNPGALLYVGMTCDPRSRRLAHKNTQPWWPEVASWRLTIYPTRVRARAVESRAIWAEQPRYNIVGRNYCPISVVHADPVIVEGLRVFDEVHTAEHGEAPSQVARKREALRLVRAAS